MIIFSEEDIHRIPMTTAVGLMREAFLLLSEGHVEVPLRTAVETIDKKGAALFMPSYAPAWQLFGLKMVSVFPGNVNAPVIQGQMLVMSASDGTPLASLDAASVTALRTGAASGLATDLLALPDASRLAVFGTGAQAWTQVAGVMAVRKINSIVVKGTSREREKTFCEKVSAVHGIACEPLNHIQDLTQADVICTATTSLQPLFPITALKPGVHINAVGAFKPTMRELGIDIMKACRFIVDQRAAVLHEAGEITIPMQEGLLTADHIHAELGEIIAEKKVGRSNSKEITVFKSVGNAIQDLAVARYLLQGRRTL